MKRFAIVGGICASFLLGAALTAVAQDEHKNDAPGDRPNAAQQDRQDQAKPQEPKQQEQAKPEARPEDRKNQEPQSGNRHETTPQSEGRPAQEPQSGDRHMQGREEHDNGRTTQGQPMNQGHAQPGQGRHIPDPEFHAHFGRPHHFAVGHVQQYQGRPSFGYSGYTFVLVNAWPTGWGYDDDNYYVDYIDGEYWLCNVRYPDVRIELIIVG